MQTRLAIKIAIVAALIVFLLIPLSMIRGVIDERAGYRHHVERDIANTWTGSQLVLGPVLSLPYQLKHEEKIWDEQRARYEIKETLRWEAVHLIAERLSIAAVVATEKRSRGIYSVPVYTAQLSVDGTFSVDALRQFHTETRGFVKWGGPQLSLAIADVRGIGLNPRLIWNGEALDFSPASVIPNLSGGIHADLPALEDQSDLPFSIEFELRGSRQLQIAPVAKDATARLESSWPHPKFNGRFLPVKTNVSADGFDAEWQVSSFSTSAQQNLDACLQSACEALRATSFGVQFIDTVDIYQKVTRATKYGILFVLLTFVAFFLTETLARSPLHPVQYTLVGFALTIFYLLLTSLSEHVSFALAYTIATSSCALLIGFYLTGVFKSAKQGFAYSGGITLLYLMLFTILRSEDFALLMGSLLIFLMLGAVMLTTHGLDWYRVGENKAVQRE